DRMWGDREDGPSDATRRPSHVPRLPTSDLEVGRVQADVVQEPLDGLTGLEIPGGLERLPPVEIRGQRLDRATRAVQGHHEMHPELLAQREVEYETLQLGKDCSVGSMLDLRLDELLERAHEEL